jgi:hypothetical protein
METMTEEEAFALDEYYTNNPPKVDPERARIRIPLARIDTAATNYVTETIKTSSRDRPTNVGELVSLLLKRK